MAKKIFDPKMSKSKSKPQYRVNNWSEYDALKKIGSLTFWLSVAVVTTNNVSDRQVFSDLLEEVEGEIDQISGDGAYDIAAFMEQSRLKLNFFCRFDLNNVDSIIVCNFFAPNFLWNNFLISIN